MTTFNVGVVGCGDIALKNYLPGTKALAGTVPAVDIIATADTRYDRAVKAAEEFGHEECTAYASLDELLSKAKPLYDTAAREIYEQFKGKTPT